MEHDQSNLARQRFLQRFRGTAKILAAAGLLYVLYGVSGAQGNLAWSAVKKTIRVRFPKVTQLSTQKLAEWLTHSDAKPLLLDARTEEEFAVSHLQGAKLAASEEEALKAIGTLDKDSPIVVYCSVGYRSSALATRLIELGYDHVQNLEGSLFEWANEGRPIYSDSSKTDVVHPYDKVWGQLLHKELWSTKLTDAKGEKKAD